ncbi:MAG: hypothetical protein GXP30_06610 [Verrucomicrobia bacterium]|nr:hypothetical protein [Verrucomicrobiota bacterium]
MGTILALFLSSIIWGVSDKTEYSCLECRAHKLEKHYVGIPVSRISNFKYTEEYLKHHPSHEHQWRWCGTILSYSLSSFTRGCGRPHPIWSLPVEVHAQYAAVVSEAELSESLSIIDTDDRVKSHEEINRIYEVIDDNMAHRQVEQ